jgi:IS5 family transposase
MAANVHDIVEANSLLHGEEANVYGDAGYTVLSGQDRQPRYSGYACRRVHWNV